MEPPIVEVQQLRKHFRIPSEERHTVREHVVGALRPRRFCDLCVLDDVTFAIARGESFGIMGPNGSGKSTLLKILAGIYRPDSGKVVIGSSLTPILELGLGWNGELTARDNVALTATAMGLTLEEIQTQLDDIVDFAELRQFIDMPLKHYSSGMSARLAYSIAFRAVRDILLLDEIFAVGDAGFMRRCEDRYRELHAAGHTLLLVSHTADHIAAFCQRAILLKNGRVTLLDRADRV